MCDKRFVYDMNIEDGSYRVFDNNINEYIFEDMNEENIIEFCDFFNDLEDLEGIDVEVSRVTLFSLIKYKLLSFFSWGNDQYFFTYVSMFCMVWFIFVRMLFKPKNHSNIYIVLQIKYYYIQAKGGREWQKKDIK